MWYNVPALLLIASGLFYSIKARKLTVPAAITGACIGLLLFCASGYTALILMTTFFLAGSLATSWKLNKKVAMGLAEEDKGRRTTLQVLANAGVAGLTAFMMVAFPNEKDVFLLMMSAAFSSAIADTLSSELGNLYGKNYYNILTLKKDQRGLNGVVSLEGTLMGMAGSCLVAFIFSFAAGLNLNVLWVVIAGTAGNLFDSVLGASLERKQLLGNNAVNFLNTLFAAIVAWLFSE